MGKRIQAGRNCGQNQEDCELLGLKRAYSEVPRGSGLTTMLP
jgi:hypothetical protein